MKLRGQVILNNAYQKTCALKIFGGDITLVKLLGLSTVDTGHILRGNLEELGAQSLFDETTGKHLDAYVESVYCDMKTAFQCIGISLVK